MAKHFHTLNGCYFSEPKIHPKNWQSGGKSSILKDWYISYYFFDPKYAKLKPYGKLVIVKGMNAYKSLDERREVTRIILQDEINALKKGYNCFTGKFMIDESVKYGILHPELDFIKAFHIAKTKLKASDSYHDQMRYALARFEKAACKLKIESIKIDDLKRRHIKQMLDFCDLTDDGYNRHRTFLSSLFNILVEYECCESNLTRDLQRKKTTKKIREIMTADQLKNVLVHLKSTDINFYRFTVIFMLSGSRITELLKVRPEHVNIDNQEYYITIRKGKSSKEVKKVILQQALPFWTDVMKESCTNTFLFSLKLKPGEKCMNRRYVTQKWKRQVKDELGVTSDFYALKHSLLDSLPIDQAQFIASHTTSKTTAIYQVNKEKRERESLKSLKVNIKVMPMI